MVLQYSDLLNYLILVNTSPMGLFYSFPLVLHLSITSHYNTLNNVCGLFEESEAESESEQKIFIQKKVCILALGF